MNGWGSLNVNVNNVVCLLFVVLMSGCDVDMFSLERKHVSNDFYIEKFSENEKFYLIQKNKDSGSGVLDGYITSVGIKNNIILVYMIPSYEGDVPGWFVVDALMKKVVGPLTQSEVLHDHRVRDITSYPIEEFYKNLGGK